ncbi:glycosyltransferase family 4 protein [Skermanella rosea]|uniref:glycosyltransferase family 4 protein n=1 Tax=Skermanella rosea TaxID=1817965 RepID=UPI00193228D6|nr:glycosyltransferase family 4 protein [Skermanella rosea]UEM03093.1 glycosyltransferase family 4 protein [Skermanella rosea]
MSGAYNTTTAGPHDNSGPEEAGRDESGLAPGRPVVLQVLPALVTGGAERGAIDVAAALHHAGGTPLVASAGGPMARELERWRIPHFTLPLDSKNPLTLWRNVDRLSRIIREHRVDIVHARSRAPAWSAYGAARRTGVPFMTTFHAPYNFSGKSKRFYNSVMARGDRVIAISEFIRDHILSNYRIDPDRIRVIHRGIDSNSFAPDRVSPERVIQLARAWRLPDGHQVIMLPGRLTRWKGQTVLIDALARLGRKDVCCLMVGSDQGRAGYRQELEEQVRRLGLEGVVRLVDHCNDMAAAYMLADVVVSASSDPEAFGRVIVEAQAMGRPVIVTNHGAVRETVVAGETAWVVPPNDADALAEALGEALALDADQRAVLGERAMAYVNSRFTRDRMCRDTLAVYGELMAERAAGSGGGGAGAGGPRQA